MEKAKQVVGSSSSSSSFTNELFGPKKPSNSSLFGSVFGPNSTGLRRDPMHSGDRGSSRIQDQGNHYGNTKYGTSDNGSNRSRGDNTKDKTLMYQYEKVEAPCNLSSSIYYGGQDVYPPTTQTSGSLNNIVKKDGRDDGSNSASRGNWWEGSLYY
ncbi:uncharacterized protein LOC132642261 isoform X2 [Lycium barbarum]|uniref:uncharacterized protein LOC132642261 isoform X2 n=1 Tax=Lycium barbarum TaxID=112863 RepID=UPI00293E65CB|nr:uncharacterized protein LOC132642261 isoform X2 [Lycium barbarum]